MRSKVNFNLILNRLIGVNGKINVITKRRKLNDGAVKKEVLIFIEIPMTKDYDKAREIIENSQYNKQSLMKGKIVIEDTDIDGIKILKGILKVNPNDKDKLLKIKQMVDKLLNLFFLYQNGR